MISKGWGTTISLWCAAALLAIPPAVHAGEPAATSAAKQPAMTSDSAKREMPDAAKRMSESKTANDATRCIQLASAALIAATKDDGVPADLLRRSMGVAVIPLGANANMQGVVSRRTEASEWSAPSFVSLLGSAGSKIAAEDGAIIVLLPAGVRLDALESGSAMLGFTDDESTPKKGAVETPPAMSAVYSYRLSGGKVERIDLTGAHLKVDAAANAAEYGKDATATTILSGQTQPTDTTKPFVASIERRVPKHEA
ncbi:MAG: hypothetical protein KC591_13905 [Gemmatimonadetes bacterium]|nr:hypothetical protein [Gemmatimonadota bacterium]